MSDKLKLLVSEPLIRTRFPDLRREGKNPCEKSKYFIIVLDCCLHNLLLDSNVGKADIDAQSL